MKEGQTENSEGVRHVITVCQLYSGLFHVKLKKNMDLFNA